MEAVKLTTVFTLPQTEWSNAVCPMSNFSFTSTLPKTQNNPPILPIPLSLHFVFLFKEFQFKNWEEMPMQ